MQNEERLTPAEREVEAALGALRAAGCGIDRDRLMFQAGRASVRRPLHIWQGTSAVLCLALAVSLAVHSRPQPAGRDEYASADGSRTSTAEVVPFETPAVGSGLPIAGGQYLRLRDEVLARGLDALPRPTAASVTAHEPGPQIERLFQQVPRASRRWGLFGLERLVSTGEQS